METFRVPTGRCYDVKSSEEDKNIKWDMASRAAKVCTYIDKGP